MGDRTADVRLVRKLVNLARFAFGPSVDRVLMMGKTRSVALGFGRASAGHQRLFVGDIGYVAHAAPAEDWLRMRSGRASPC